MAIFLSEDSNFKISGVFLADLLQLAESVEKEGDLVTDAE